MSGDGLTAAREQMKQDHLAAGLPVTERWHTHPSLDFCGPQCPAGGTGWDGKGLVIDHFADVAAPALRDTQGQS